MSRGAVVFGVALALFGLGPGGPARAAEPLVADLTSHLIAITTGFTGASVVLFGAIDAPGEVIVVVRGPDREAVVRQKSRVAGIWINKREVTFTGVPSFYAIFSRRPLDQIASAVTQGLHQLGIGNLRLGVAARSVPADQVPDYRAALIREQQRAQLYAEEVGGVSFLPGDRLFRATINFPANVPTGTYRVEVLLVRDKTVISGQTTPLFISQSGLDAEVSEFADRRAWFYGIVAVAGAAMAGWLASLPFRNA